ncbi:MAG TPA: hypothetical protein VGM30_21625 [Puia sp.]|jgi:hypothetical protein
MKALFYKIGLIFIGVAVIFEIVFGLVLPRLVLGSKDTYLTRWRQFYKQTDGADLVCLGSSRVLRHCDPTILSAITHARTEVIAVNGAKPAFFEKMYADWLTRNPRPKVLVVGIDLTGLGSVAVTPFPEYFYPGMRSSDQIARMSAYDLIRYHKPFGYFYYKEIYAYDLEFPEGPPHVDGFLPSEATWQEAEWAAYTASVPNGYGLGAYAPTIKELFRFMREEKKAGVVCVGVLSPEYSGIWKKENDRQRVLQEVYREAGRQQVPIFNFSDGSYRLCFDKKYFYDFEHLNKAGSAIFSKDLADSLVKNYYGQ